MNGVAGTTDREAVPASPFMDVADVAAFLKVKLGTVRGWRKLGLMPPAHKFGSRVMWQRADIEAWAQDRRERTAARRAPVVQCSRVSLLKGLGR